MATMMSTAWGCGVYRAGNNRAPMYRESKFMKRASTTNGAMGKGFLAAVLLTGGVKQAEAAMLEAIRRMDAEQVSDQTFLLDCVKAAMAISQKLSEIMALCG